MHDHPVCLLWTQRSGDSANGVQHFGPRCSRYVRPPVLSRVGTSERIPVFALLDTMMPPGVPTIISFQCSPYLDTTGTAFGRKDSTLEPRTADVGSDIDDGGEVHPVQYQVLSVDGQCKEIIMINDGPMPVFFSPGTLVVHVRLIDSDVTPSYLFSGVAWLKWILSGIPVKLRSTDGGDAPLPGGLSVG